MSAGDARPLATPVVQVDTAQVRVTEWTFAPGAQTGCHVHPMDYAVVPLTSGRLRLEEPEGVRAVQLQAGGSHGRLAGVAHNVINANGCEFRFVEIVLR